MNAQALSLQDVEQLLNLCGTGEKSSQAVLVALDFEAYEFNQSYITETGVTILDLKTLDPTIATTDFLRHWKNKLRSVHYITSEYRRFVNKRHVKGHPDKFSFGKSRFVSRIDLARVLSRIFRDPSNLESAHDLDFPIIDQHREIVLVGHALKNEFKYGNAIGFAPGNVLSKCDTLLLSKFGTKNEDISLDKLLSLLKIEQKYLHNAGNDAAYTMQALLALAVQHAENPVQLQSDYDTLLAPMRAKRLEQQLLREAKKAEREKADKEKAAKENDSKKQEKITTWVKTI